LGAARFVGLLYGPIDRHLSIDQALRKALRYRLPAYAGWRHAFGGITYLLFIVLVVTGVLLSFYYRPSPQEAYPSVQHIVSDIPFGWLIRDLHVWSASLIVIAVLAHMARVFFTGAYKPPRETNWLVGLLLLFVVLAFGSTGYLLPWDQWAYWTVTEVLRALDGVPLLRLIPAVVRGDVIVSGATLSRYFALHVIVLPWVALALLIYHFILVRRRGIAPPPGVPTDKEGGRPFFPDHLLRSFIASALVLAFTISLAALFPRPVGQPADPSTLPEQLISTWVPVDVALAFIRFVGPWGLAVFTLLGVSLALLPLFDRRPEQRLRKRPVVATLGAVFVLIFAVAWVAGRTIGSVPPTAPTSEVVEVPASSPETPLERLGPTPVRPAPSPDTGAGARGPS
jgi:quinol-cytochrome oxidoreductase complex cytochrome b subunit